MEPPAALGGLVLLAPAGQPDDALLKDALFGAQRAGGACVRRPHGGAVFVTVSRLDGAFGLGDLDPRRDPLDGGLAGLAKTAAWEWAEVQCKAIDLGGDWADADEAADALAEELLRGRPDRGGPAPLGTANPGKRGAAAVRRQRPSAVRSGRRGRGDGRRGA